MILAWALPPTSAVRVIWTVTRYGPRSVADSASIRLASGATPRSRLASCGAYEDFQSAANRLSPISRFTAAFTAAACVFDEVLPYRLRT